MTEGAEKKARVSRKHAPDAVITVKDLEKPFRAGSKRDTNFSKLATGMTVAEAKEAIGEDAHSFLVWFESAGFITVE